jgi:WS/DGAT/MGAT family acyltransferase
MGREPLSNVDTAWLRMEIPTNLMMISGIMTFSEPLSYERLLAVVEKRLLIFKRFKRKVAAPPTSVGQYYFEDDPNFDIRLHLHRVNLPAPADHTALQDFVSEMMSKPLDMTKPLWEFHLIEQYGEGSALLGRMHHSIGDGIALIRVLLSMTDDKPDTPLEIEPPEIKRTGRGGLGSMIRKATKTTLKMADMALSGGQEILQDPARLTELAKLGASGMAAFGRLTLRPPDARTLFKGKLGVMKRAAWSQPIPLADVKRLGKVTDGTVNDVLLTAMTGALRRYLVAKGEDVEGLNFRAVIPVNLRPLDGPIELGNKFGLVFLSLPVGIEDELERLWELKRRMDALKDTPEAVVALGILNTMGIVPTDLENVLVDLFEAKATAVMTNVPGPRQQIYMGGIPVDSIMFWVPQSGRLGLGISIISYNDQVWMGVATDDGLVPDPDIIIENFHVEFDHMMKLVYQVEEE